MAIFKCKMCGGDLQITEGESVCVCEYCGTRQTVPSLDNDKKISLFTRANRLRSACDFDKAAGVYENIVAEFPEEAEAYWGLVLCKYGIEYVDDPKSGKKMPTCHRSSFDSVMDDPNFDLVMEYSDSVSRAVYRSEAKEIERIRNSIIEISTKEDPYDIFICYKEKDENGERTIDSVMAQDVYDALVGKGYRVFFSRISLEDKLGEEYEPYIFSALNSAKIMLVFGTDYEYFNAVWVKNEWSRFLSLIENGAKKTLIPCFKDIDAYDIPKEFSHLQAQDMGKVGAMQDLLRGIDKIMGGKTVADSNAVEIENRHSFDNKTEPLLKRAFMFLGDEEWEKADNYCEQVLDIDPENSQAYVGKLLSELRVHSESELSEQGVRFDSFNNYKKAIQFGNTTLKEELDEFRNRIYDQAIDKYKSAKNVEDCDETAKMLDMVLDWKDASNISEKCKEKKKGILTKLHNISNKVANFIRVDGPLAVGLTADGKVLAKALNKNINSKTISEIQSWRDIIDISYSSTASYYTPSYVLIGLRVDGTVVAAGENDRRKFDVKNWKGIISIKSSDDHTVGLKADGTVVATGGNSEGQCKVQDWRDIVSIGCCNGLTAGLRADGSVVAVGKNDYGQCNVKDWKNIVSIECVFGHITGLRSDGTALTTGFTDISQWRDIKEIHETSIGPIAIKQDGTLIYDEGKNEMVRFNLKGWKDIQDVVTLDMFSAFGLRTDGTVISTTNECKEVYSNGTRIIINGNQNGECKVDSWENIISIAVSYGYSVGLKSDGTVVAVGSNDHGRCNVKQWHDIVAVVCNGQTYGIKADGKVVVTEESGLKENSFEGWRLFDSSLSIEDMLDQSNKNHQINRLYAQKDLLLDEIDTLRKECETAEVPSLKMQEEVSSKIQEMETQRSRLGIFKGKEKQRITDQIEELKLTLPDDSKIEAERQELYEKEYRSAIDELKPKIEDLTNRISLLQEEKE